MTSQRLDTDEVAKLVDSTYKNILDKFNPSARQLIAAGKAYLKALHGASAASKAYLEALSRLSGHAEESAGHGATDIGETLNDIVQTYSEIRNHELTLLKAFYVDLVAPMESNIEKDWRVVQAEHKRFTSHWRTLQDSFGRAQVGVKKSQKKLKNSKSSTMLDKEIKQIQRFDEEKIKCEMFLEKSLKDVMTQERRRYGFVLERQCSLAKHFHALHRTGESCLSQKLEEWNQVAQTREKLSADVERCFSGDTTQFDSLSKDGASVLKRNRSVDSSALQSPEHSRLVRTRSNYELHSSTTSLHMMTDPVEVEVSSATPPRPAWDTDSSDSASAGSHCERPLVRAVYAYLSSGEHQLSFHEGDTIACIGERNKGWQFGENVRTHRCGWFPAAYTELVADSGSSQGSESSADASAAGSRQRSVLPRPEEAPLSLSTFRPPPPGALTVPAKRPTSVHAELSSRLAARKLKTACNSGHLPPPPPPPLPPEMKRSQTTPVLNGPADTSLHSSNDSGFGADQHPPPPDQFASDPRSGGGGGGGSLPQTSRGWLIFSQGDNTELLRPYLEPAGRKSVQFSGDGGSSSAGGGSSSGSASLLDHFVTIDRKARRRASRAKLGRKASLLRAFRPSAADEPLSSSELWRTPGEEADSPVAGAGAGAAAWPAPPATIPEEAAEPGRTSPRSLSESDLLDLDSGDTFLLVQDYRAVTVAETERRASRGGGGAEPAASPPPPPQQQQQERRSALFAPDAAVEHRTAREPMSLPAEPAAPAAVFHSVARMKSASRARRPAPLTPLHSMTAVIGEESEPASLPVDIHACAARHRRAHDAARRRTVGAFVTEAGDSGAPGGATRKHDTFSIFQTEAEYEDLRYDVAAEAALTPTAGAGAGAARRPGGELRRHNSVVAPSVGEKLRKFNIDLFNYGSYLSRRLYLPEKDSTLEEGAEEGQRCGPWYDLWAADASCDPQVQHSETPTTTIHQ